MPDEIIQQATYHVGLIAKTVGSIGKQQKIEVLVRPDQLVDDEQRVVGRDVVVHRAVRQKQLSLEILCHGLSRLWRVIVAAIGGAHQQPLITLAPVVLILALIVITCFGDSDPEEVRILKHCRSGGESSTGVTVDSGAIDIDPRVPPRKLLHARDLIRKRVVSHLAVIRVVERLRPPGRAHSIDLHNDESKLRERLGITTRGRKAATSDASCLWSGINVIYDWVLLRAIQIG